MSEYYDEDNGIHFDPTENELIKDYLSPKIKEGKEFDFIWNMDVYATEPWLLKHNMNPSFKKYEWYYFATRNQVSKNNIGRGKKAKRQITGDNGHWKANASEEILDEVTGKTIGEKQTLTFIKSKNDDDNNNNKKQKRENGTSATIGGSDSDSSWIMTEYMLAEEDKFQGRVLCKIHEIKKGKNNKEDHDEASASRCTYYHYHRASSSSSSSSEQHRINDHESDFASALEQQLINEHESSLASFSEQQPINEDDYDSASSLELQPTSINCNIQEDERDDRENPIPHHHEFGQASSSDANEDWIANYMNEYTTRGFGAFFNNVKDQQQAPISAHLSEVNVSSAPLGDRSRPIQLDEEEDDGILEVYAFTREEEVAPNLQWMNQ